MEKLSKAQKRFQDLILSKKSFYVKREDYEKLEEEIIILKSKLLVSDGWVEYYKNEVNPLRLMHKAELTKNIELIDLIESGKVIFINQRDKDKYHGKYD